MRLLLVRHGESICGVNGVVGGAKGCTGLTERGVEQVRALADRFELEGFVPDDILASTLLRARQTAEVLAERWGTAVSTRPDLRELDPGEIDGTLWDDHHARGGGFDMVAEPDRPLSPGGESLNAFRERIASVIEQLRTEYDGRTVLAACHGGPIFMSMLTSFATPTGERVFMRPEFTSVTEWEQGDGRWLLHRYNDAGHLRGTNLLAEV